MSEEPVRDRRVTVDELLPGIAVRPLPERWTPLDAVVMVKCLNERGETAWALRTTNGVNNEELLGALTVRADLLRRDLLARFGPAPGA